MDLVPLSLIQQSFYSFTTFVGRIVSTGGNKDMARYTTFPNLRRRLRQQGLRSSSNLRTMCVFQKPRVAYRYSEYAGRSPFSGTHNDGDPVQQ